MLAPVDADGRFRLRSGRQSQQQPAENASFSAFPYALSLSWQKDRF
jgi:hypothetical protein